MSIDIHLSNVTGLKDHEDVIHRPTGQNMAFGKIGAFVAEQKEKAKLEAQKQAGQAIGIATTLANDFEALKNKLISLGLDPNNLPDSLPNSNAKEEKGFKGKRD